jgi:hypothetical protein
MVSLAEARAVVGLPPESSFGGHSYDLACALIDTLQSVGPKVMAVTSEEWDDVSLRQRTVARLREFSPHFAFAIPQTGYALRFKTTSGENLFADTLGIPLVLPWDHLLTQAPAYFLSEMYSRPQVRGALKDLRRGLEHPLFHHYAPDSAHIKVYESLGLLSPGRMQTYMPSADRHFLNAGSMPTEPAIHGRVGFAGNIYSAYGRGMKLLQQAFVRDLDAALLSAKRQNWAISGWELLNQILASISSEVREQNGLTPDFPLFWWIALDLLSYRVTTDFRLCVLESIEAPVDFYGNFVDPESSSLNAGRITFFESVAYKSLPDLFRRYEVWVDVTNAPFISGCGAKVFNCFAAGAFMLIDCRADVRDAVGAIADKFMYRDAADLNEKVNHYLEHPEERGEIVEQMQAIVRQRFTWECFYIKASSEAIGAYAPACSD